MNQKTTKGFILKSGKGTKLYKNIALPLQITLKSAEKPIDWENLWMIKGNQLNSTLKFNQNIKKSHSIRISSNEFFMLLNLTDLDIDLSFSTNINEFQEIYDPYLYEKSEKITLNPIDMQKIYKTPSNYIDILAKWYSVKFSYKNYNLIFLKPQLGISLQSHKLRSEHWEILSGHPLIIIENSLFDAVDPKNEFDIKKDTLHTVINPSEHDWVVLKETYGGVFDEEDIQRVFNPNNYQSKTN